MLCGPQQISGNVESAIIVHRDFSLLPHGDEYRLWWYKGLISTHMNCFWLFYACVSYGRRSCGTQIWSQIRGRMHMAAESNDSCHVIDYAEAREGNLAGDSDTKEADARST